MAKLRLLIPGAFSGDDQFNFHGFRIHELRDGSISLSDELLDDLDESAFELDMGLSEAIVLYKELGAAIRAVFSTLQEEVASLDAAG